MKKLFTLTLTIITLFAGQHAFALTPTLTKSILFFTQIEQTSVTMEVELGTSDRLGDRAREGYDIMVQYRPWMCGDDEGDDMCPAIYAQPKTA